VVTAAGRAFCAGADLNILLEAAADGDFATVTGIPRASRGLEQYRRVVAERTCQHSLNLGFPDAVLRRSPPDLRSVSLAPVGDA
jgi:hypothetical protein